MKWPVSPNHLTFKITLNIIMPAQPKSQNIWNYFTNMTRAHSTQSAISDKRSTWVDLFPCVFDPRSIHADGVTRRKVHSTLSHPGTLRFLLFFDVKKLRYGEVYRDVDTWCIDQKQKWHTTTAPYPAATGKTKSMSIRPHDSAPRCVWYDRLPSTFPASTRLFAIFRNQIRIREAVRLTP